MKKSPLNFTRIPGFGGQLSGQIMPMPAGGIGNILAGIGGPWNAQNLAQQQLASQGISSLASMIQGNNVGSGAGVGPAAADPNNTSTTGNFNINPNAWNFSTAYQGTPMADRTDSRGGFIGGMTGDYREATGAPGQPTQFSDGSEGYRVNRFGGFAGPTGGGAVPANVATANQFSTNTQHAARQIFGNGTQIQPRKLINL